MSSKYVQFPLFMVKDFFAHPYKTADEIMSYGTCHYAERISCTPGEAAFYILEHVQQIKLGYKIDEYLLNCGNKIINEFHYVAYLFCYPEITHVEINEMLGLFEADPDFEEKALQYMRVGKAMEELGLSGGHDRTIREGNRLKNLIPKKEPMPMVSIQHLFDYRKHDKSEFEIAQLLAYLTIRSILGVKPYVRTNKALILSRTFGYSKKLPADVERTPLQKKYATRYHMDKVLSQLEFNWGVKIYGHHMRGFYVTAGSKMTLDELAIKAEASKKKNLLADLKNRKATARNRAEQQLNNNITTPTTTAS
jgi:hypothetical protein